MYRELLGFLIWREILIRYKQTAIGIAWAVIQPVITMVVFTVIFGKLAKFSSGSAPYAIMVYAAVLPWQFFANALTQSSNSVISAGNMVRKIYFPRIFIPASASLSGVLDFTISLLILFGLMLFYGVGLRPHLLLLPLFFIIAFATSFGAGLWLGALNVKYRDVKFAVPFLVRLGMYISPIGFMTSVIPDKWLFWFSLNPLVGVIDGFRWAILGPEFEPYWPGLCISLAMVLVLLITGAFFFRCTEKTFADLI
jgi:lipopolysaccharide transport system permease protein